MIVREIRLENVKSYGSPAEVIRLSRGVNAICGANGAGKSTVLEAIGCALFQHLPYRQEEFVREGETSGTITVVVESRVDQRTYEVVRKVGRGSSQYVYDPDIGQQIARGEADVRRWLHQHLRIDEEVDLRTLFLDSVGPPQGTLTAAFLESRQDRIGKFNRLLRVEEYEEAYRRLAALDAALADDLKQVELAIAGLEPQVAKRAAVESERAATRDRQYELAKQRQRVWAEKAEVEREITELALAEQRWREAGTALARAGERKESVEGVLASRAEEHRRAAAASEVCSRARAGYDAYLSADAALRSLEAEQARRDQLGQERHESELRDAQLSAKLQHLAGEIARAEQAAVTAAELLKQVPAQEAAEERRQTALLAKQESEQIEERLAVLEAQVTRAAARLSQAEQAVASALANQPLAAELPARQVSYAQLKQALDDANRAEGELKALRGAVQQSQQRVTRIRQQLEVLDRRIEMAAAAERVARSLPALDAEHRRIADERAAAASQLAHAQSTRSQVAGGLCPFLHETCRNLRPGVTLATHFDGQIEHWSAELDRLATALGELTRRLDDAREASARLAGLPDLREQRERAAAELAETQQRLSADQERLQSLARVASQRSEAERAEQAALALLREAERAHQEVSRLPRLRQELEAARQECREREAELETARARLVERKAIAADLPAAIAALNALNSPRERAAHLREEARRLPELRAEHDGLLVDRARVQARLAELDGALAPYQDLDARLTTQRARRERNRRDYEAYTTNAALAATLDERAQALRQAEEEALTARRLLAEAQQAVEVASQAYHAADHERALARKAQLERDDGELQARLEEAERAEQRLSAELEQIRATELELAARRRDQTRIEEERQLVDALRRAVRAAGPEITRQLLTRISRMASRINAEILNQSAVELEWRPDYEIVTRRQGETRGFAQLSGGEQMAAALAVRLAILRDLSNVRIAFLDEPTAHLDQERRSNLGEQVQRLQGFDQLVVISHDDTFDGLFGHVIRIGREGGRSRVLD